MIRKETNVRVKIRKQLRVVLSIIILAFDAISAYIKSDFTRVKSDSMAESVCRHAESISNDERSSTSSIGGSI